MSAHETIVHGCYPAIKQAGFLRVVVLESGQVHLGARGRKLFPGDEGRITLVGNELRVIGESFIPLAGEVARLRGLNARLWQCMACLDIGRASREFGDMVTCQCEMGRAMS